MCLEEAGVGELVSHCKNLNFVASLVPVGNRIYHQRGSGCRSHGSCLDGIEPDARLNVVGMVVGDQPLVLYYYYYYFSGTGLATVFTTRGGRVQDSWELLCGIEPVTCPRDVCTGWSLRRVKPGLGTQNYFGNLCIHLIRT